MLTPYEMKSDNDVLHDNVSGKQKRFLYQDSGEAESSEYTEFEKRSLSVSRCEVTLAVTEIIIV